MGLFRNRKDIGEDLEAREREKMHGIAAGLKKFDDDDDDSYDVYEMALKKRSISGMLSQALRDEGAGDMVKKIKWRKRRISEDET